MFCQWITQIKESVLTLINEVDEDLITSSVQIHQTYVCISDTARVSEEFQYKCKCYSEKWVQLTFPVSEIYIDDQNAQISVTDSFSLSAALSLMNDSRDAEIEVNSSLLNYLISLYLEDFQKHLDNCCSWADSCIWHCIQKCDCVCQNRIAETAFLLITHCVWKHLTFIEDFCRIV